MRMSILAVNRVETNEGARRGGEGKGGRGGRMEDEDPAAREGVPQCPSAVILLSEAFNTSEVRSLPGEGPPPRLGAGSVAPSGPSDVRSRE